MIAGAQRRDLGGDRGVQVSVLSAGRGAAIGQRGDRSERRRIEGAGLARTAPGLVGGAFQRGARVAFQGRRRAIESARDRRVDRRDDGHEPEQRAREQARGEADADGVVRVRGDDHTGERACGHGRDDDRDGTRATRHEIPPHGEPRTGRHRHRDVEPHRASDPHERQRRERTDRDGQPRPRAVASTRGDDADRCGQRAGDQRGKRDSGGREREQHEQRGAEQQGEAEGTHQNPTSRASLPTSRAPMERAADAAAAGAAGDA